MQRYLNRQEAGVTLAAMLRQYEKDKETLILALPRGGVPVAFEVAQSLSLPLDVFIVRKLGVPGHEELAMGAIAADGNLVLHQDLIHQLHIPQSAIHNVMDTELKELTRRELIFRHNRFFPDILAKTIILIDDGIATGASIKVAIQTLRMHKPARLVLAVPVAAESTCNALAPLVDDLICPMRPIQLHAVGFWYDNFQPTSDEEVVEMLKDNFQPRKSS
jgi:putative phosphoribosyl transferase